MLSCIVLETFRAADLKWLIMNASFAEIVFIWQTHLWPRSGLDLEQRILDKWRKGGSKENRYKWEETEDSFKTLDPAQFYKRWPL